MAVSQSISLTQGTQSIENNTTQVTFKWTSTQSGDSYNGYTKTAYYYVSINGGAETKYSVSYTLPKSSTTTIVSKTFTVKHKDNGEGSISIRTWMDTGISAGVVQKSKSLSLTAIPRASTIDSVTCNTSYFNGTLTYKYTPKSASFYNRCNISLNLNGALTHLKTIDIGQKSIAQQTGTVTLSTSELSAIYNKLPTMTKGTLRFTFRTYSDSGYSKQIGGAPYKEISLNIPTSVKPKLGTITLNPLDITTSDGTARDIFVQGRNKMRVYVNGSSPGQGGSIKSYTFTALYGSTVLETKTITTTANDTYVDIGPFSKVGDLKFRVSLTDSRSMTANNNGSEAVGTCYAYSTPSFISFKAYRCDSNGNTNDNGTNIKYSLGIKGELVNGTNNYTVKIYYKKNTDSSYTTAKNALTKSTSTSATEKIQNSSGTAITFDANSTYLVYATLTDNYGSSVKSPVLTIFGASRIFNIKANGNGIAFGKMADQDNLFESKWPAKFDNGLTVGTSTQTNAPTSGIHIHDVRDAEITPESFGYKNANFYFDQVEGRWASILHMMGWESNTNGQYAAWELAGNASTSSYDDTLKYRQGVGTWGDWQTVLTNKNIQKYKDSIGCLPLSGGTLTGKLTLKGSQYYGQDAAGIDCQNSDITNINGLYFSDAADTPGEGINLYNSTGKWDTIYTSGGDLRYQPGRETSGTPNGYKVFHTGNLAFRSDKCTLSSSSTTTITFSSAMPGTPIVMLTPLTTSSGAIAGKVTNVTTNGFSAIIGGSAVSSAQFAYLAIWY